jgi:hypothetical protein
VLRLVSIVSVGLRNLVFLPGQGAGVDFKREKGSTEAYVIAVREVAMIHPYWDMALLRVEGLGTDHPPRALSLTQPEDLIGEDVARIGYPAFDLRRRPTTFSRPQDPELRWAGNSAGRPRHAGHAPTPPSVWRNWHRGRCRRSAARSPRKRDDGAGIAVQGRTVVGHSGHIVGAVPNRTEISKGTVKVSAYVTGSSHRCSHLTRTTGWRSMRLYNDRAACRS